MIQGAVCKKDLNKIISLLYLEFHQDIQIVKQFINNVQFLGNEYLLFHGFSIGLKDCLINNKKETVESTVQKAIMKAKNINMNVRNPYIKEVYTRYSLIAARDMGLSISKKCMDEDNNFKIAVESGSKANCSIYARFHPASDRWKHRKATRTAIVWEQNPSTLPI